MISTIRKTYNITKQVPIEDLKLLLPSHINRFGVKNLLINLSNQEFKSILRNNGITSNSDIYELVNLKKTRSTSLLADSRINSVISTLNDSEIEMMISKSSDLSVVVVASESQNLLQPISSDLLGNINNILEIGGYAIDLAMALRSCANGEGIDFADLFFFLPGASWLIKQIVKDISFDSYMWEYELPWSMISKWYVGYDKQDPWRDQLGIPVYLYMQYTSHYRKANSLISPTSFIILDANLANEIFGFTPVYVNYNNEDGFNNDFFIPVSQSSEIEW